MRQARYVLIDDIDGSTAQDRVTFAVGRQQYEIDLNDKHLKQFNDEMERWISSARKISGRRGAGKTAAPAPKTSDAALIRAWASERGIKMAERGRIPSVVRDQYYAEAGQA